MVHQGMWFFPEELTRRKGVLAVIALDYPCSFLSCTQSDKSVPSSYAQVLGTLHSWLPVQIFLLGILNFCFYFVGSLKNQLRPSLLLLLYSLKLRQKKFCGIIFGEQEIFLESYKIIFFGIFNKMLPCYFVLGFPGSKPGNSIIMP